ncbi:MAG: UbiX family flavin prenyltransferase [Candidatus Obscuribacterales bacterium]|nr:UbiX family flavin prenyltransferase [Candidatus Obscuribacterales bacterium]
MSTAKDNLPFVLAMTGASGSVYGLRLLQYLLEIEQPVEMLLSKAAIMVMREEMDLKVGSDAKDFLIKYLSLPQNSPLTMHDLGNYGATVSSGSYRTKGMAVVPCSVGTLGALAAGLTENLIQRAAAVTLKEKRKLLILLREMPFGQIQLKNMLTLSEAGAIVSAASPGFYHKPQSISDQVDFVVGRVLDQFEFDHALFKRWKGNAKPLPSLTGRESL